MNLPKPMQILVLAGSLIFLAGTALVTLTMISAGDPTPVQQVAIGLQKYGDTDAASQALSESYGLGGQNPSDPTTWSTQGRDCSFTDDYCVFNLKPDLRIVAYIIDAQASVIGGREYSGLTISTFRPERVKGGTVTVLTNDMSQLEAARIIFNVMAGKHKPLSVVALPL